NPRHLASPIERALCLGSFSKSSFTAKLSITILSWLLTRSVDSLCCQSLLWFFILAWVAFSACLAFKRFLLFFCLRDRLLLKYLIFDRRFFKKWGLLISAIPSSAAIVAKCSNPTSIPTMSFAVEGFCSSFSISQAKQTYQYLPSLITVVCLIFP